MTLEQAAEIHQERTAARRAVQARQEAITASRAQTALQGRAADAAFDERLDALKAGILRGEEPSSKQVALFREQGDRAILAEMIGEELVLEAAIVAVELEDAAAAEAEGEVIHLAEQIAAHERAQAEALGQLAELEGGEVCTLIESPKLRALRDAARDATQRRDAHRLQGVRLREALKIAREQQQSKRRGRVRR